MQLGSNLVGVEASRPVDLRCCVDIKLLKSTIALELISSVASYEDLTDMILLANLNKDVSESRNTVTLASLDTSLNRYFPKNPDTSYGMSYLYIEYQILLPQYGLSRILESSKNKRYSMHSVP